MTVKVLEQFVSLYLVVGLENKPGWRVSKLISQFLPNESFIVILAVVLAYKGKVHVVVSPDLTTDCVQHNKLWFGDKVRSASELLLVIW